MVGVAVGRSLLPMIAFEFEYATGARDSSQGIPSYTTFMGQFVVQSPRPVHRTILYASGGVGVWNDSYGDGRGAGGLGYAYVG